MIPLTEKGKSIKTSRHSDAKITCTLPEASEGAQVAKVCHKVDITDVPSNTGTNG